MNKTSIKVIAKTYADGSCPNCGSLEWYEGANGGASVNVKCAKCGLWFNNTPFGLKYSHEHSDPPKEVVWGYCIQCKKVHGGEFFLHASGGEYPKCIICESYLSTCWLVKDFPGCHECEIRFKCYTER